MQIVANLIGFRIDGRVQNDFMTLFKSRKVWERKARKDLVITLIKNARQKLRKIMKTQICNTILGHIPYKIY